MEKLYKVINKNKQSMNGGSFDWEKYLPKGEKPGKWTPTEKKASICNNGYHLTKHWNMWIQSPDDLVFEAEAKNTAWKLKHLHSHSLSHTIDPGHSVTDG